MNKEIIIFLITMGLILTCLAWLAFKSRKHKYTEIKAAVLDHANRLDYLECDDHIIQVVKIKAIPLDQDLVHISCVRCGKEWNKNSRDLNPTEREAYFKFKGNTSDRGGITI